MFPRDFLKERAQKEELKAVEIDMLILPIFALVGGLFFSILVFAVERMKVRKLGGILEKHDGPGHPFKTIEE